MKKFVKDNLITIVDDDDRRIPDYIAAGWKPADVEPKPQDEADRRRAKAIDDANASEGGGKRRKTASDKKINDAIKANDIAAAEGEVVDDGLIKGGKK